MDKVESKGVAYVNWPKESAPEKGMNYGVEAKDIAVWLRCHEDSMQFSVMKARLHPGTSPKTAMLLIACPMCGRTTGQQLRIPGSDKTFQWELLPEPRPVGISDVPEDEMQTIRISVMEDMGCPVCKRYFKLTDNVLHKA